MDVFRDDIAAVGEAARGHTGGKGHRRLCVRRWYQQRRRAAYGRRRRHRHQPNLSSDQGVRRRLLCTGTSFARGRPPMGSQVAARFRQGGAFSICFSLPCPSDKEDVQPALERPTARQDFNLWATFLKGERIECGTGVQRRQCRRR